jgi:glycosyltransferase involved in cell wall biosynthesis
VKIHALCIVKNEADVLQEALTSALHWCDHIYVFDNGSNDGTWELVHELAKHYPQIVPYKQDDVIFSDGLRADIFNAFRSEAGPKDWWCRLDADEFYIDDPRVFLSKIPHRYNIVWTASFNYYFTDEDSILYRQDPIKYPKIPVERRLRYYLNHWSEPRFFRHSGAIVWTRDHGGFPVALDLARAYPVRIWMKHYEYRSPEQIERRLLTRRAAIMGGKLFHHETVPHWADAVTAIRDTGVLVKDAHPEFAGTRWEERIVSASALDYDTLDRRYVLNERLMPRIPRPRLGAVLPESIRGPVAWMLRQPPRVLRRLRRIMRDPLLFRWHGGP